MKRLGVNVLILIFALMALGVLLEGGFRLQISPETEIDKDWVRQFIKYNRDGFRDREFAVPKPRGIFRILAVGDSQTFGHGIERLEDTFPKRLETLLNEGMKRPRFEVLNFARPGWNTDTQLQYIYKKGFHYQPDLILLNFFHNDLPPSAFFDCDSSDWEFVPKMGSLVQWLHNSMFYHFFKFRINRLLEKIGYKPSYENCRRASYQSRSWDMEEIYLDTLLHTTQMKGIHFMIAVLPVMFRLDGNYPFEFAHKKLTQYCQGRNLFCVDLYQEGFQGKNEDDFILSRKDRHLNSRGSGLAAQILFEKLKPLKTYQNLNRWHLAFDLKDMLELNKITAKFDLHFAELDVSPMILRNAKEEILALSDGGNYYVLRTRMALTKGKRMSLRRIILERDGQMVKSERKTFDPFTGDLTRHEITDLSKEKILQTIKTPKLGDEKGFIETKRTYVFAYHSEYQEDSDKFVWELEIQENTRFLDPLNLESILFSPNQLHLDRLDVSKLRRGLEFYITFPFYEKGSGTSYVQKLAGAILRTKPSKEAIQVVQDLEKWNKESSLN